MSKKSRRPGRRSRHERARYEPEPHSTFYVPMGDTCPVCDMLGIEVDEDGRIVDLEQIDGAEGC